MKFAIFGNTYQAKKSSHAATLFKLLEKHGLKSAYAGVSSFSEVRFKTER